MTNRQTQFSRSLQGTAQDLQRIQQVIASLTDTIRGVSREFSALLTGANQASIGLSQSQQIAQSFMTPKGESLASALLGTAQQRLMEDIARYKAQDADRTQSNIAQFGSASQDLKILENNARRAAGGRADTSLLQIQNPNFMRDVIHSRIGTAPAGDPEAVAFAAQQRLKEGMSVPEVSMLLKQSLPREQLEAFSRYSSDFGSMSRKMSGIQTMVGLPDDRVRAHIIAAEQTHRTKEEARQRADHERFLEVQKIDAHKSLPAGFSSADRTRAIQLATITGDSSLMMSMGDIRRSRSSSDELDRMIDKAERESERLRSSTSGIERATADELSNVVKELVALRQATEKADDRLYTAMTKKGVVAGSEEYNDLVRNLKDLTDKQAQAAERLKDLTPPPPPSGSGGSGGWTPQGMLSAGMGAGMAALGLYTSVGRLGDTVLSANIGANRRAISSEAEMAQIHMQRYLESASMSSAENILKYQADVILPDYQANSLRYIGGQRRQEALAEASREVAQTLEIGQRQYQRAPWEMAAQFFYDTTTHTAGGFMVGGKAGAVLGLGTGVMRGVSGVADKVGALETNPYVAMQGGVAGVSPELIGDFLTKDRTALYKEEKIRETTRALGASFLRNREDIQNSEVQTKQVAKQALERWLPARQAYFEGARMVGAHRSAQLSDMFANNPEYQEYTKRISTYRDAIRDAEVELIDAAWDVKAAEYAKANVQFRMKRALRSRGMRSEEARRNIDVIREEFGDRWQHAAMGNEYLRSYNENISKKKEQVRVKEIERAKAAKAYEDNLNTFSGATESSRFGMSVADYIRHQNMRTLYDAPGTTWSPSDSERKTSRMLDIAMSGTMTSEDYLQNIARAQSYRGGDGSQALESILARAVSSGFDNARTSQMFTSAVQDLSESMKIMGSSIVEDRIALSSSLLGRELGKPDEMSLRRAASEVQSWSAVSGSREGVMGVRKLQAALSAGFGVGTGLEYVQDLNEVQLADAEAQLREHLSTGKEIADARLRVFARQHGPEKMLEMLGKYGDLGPRGVIKEQLGKFGFNVEKEIDSIFRMEKMEGESDLEFRKRQQSRISELSVVAGDILGMTTTGTEGGSGGVMSIIEREARSRNVPVPGLKTSQEAHKALNDRAKAVVDPADRTFFESINKLVASAIGEAADRGNIQDDVLRALDRGGINLPGGGKITKEDWRAGRVSPEDMEELRKELSSGDARFKLVTMSTLEKERNAARGDAEVGAGDAAPKIENFSKEVSGFVSNISKASKTLENIVMDLEEINKNTIKIRLEAQ